MNGQQIVNASEIGKIADDVTFLDGRTMADYKAMLITIADKALSMIPQVVAQLGREETKSQLETMFLTAAKKNWKGATDYWTTNSNGDKAITIVSRWQLEDVSRILCNIVDRS